MKLVPNLRKKQRYIIHYRNLKLYQSLGMQVTKIDRWQQATSEFEKDFFRLLNNSVFGKTMENQARESGWI